MLATKTDKDGKVLWTRPLCAFPKGCPVPLWRRCSTARRSGGSRREASS